MEIRRPLAALVTALALLGGSASLTACGSPTGQDRNDGTTDDSGDQTSGNDPAGVSQGQVDNHGDTGDGEQGTGGDQDNAGNNGVGDGSGG